MCDLSHHPRHHCRRRARIRPELLLPFETPQEQRSLDGWGELGEDGELVLLGV
jgi:hypothetical protein